MLGSPLLSSLFSTPCSIRSVLELSSLISHLPVYVASSQWSPAQMSLGILMHFLFLLMCECLQTNQNNHPTLIVYFISAERFRCNENKMFIEQTQIFQKKRAHLTCFERWMSTISFDIFYIYLLTWQLLFKDLVLGYCCTYVVELFYTNARISNLIINKWV